MQFQTVFDVVNVGYRDWYGPAIALGIGAIVLLLFLVIKAVGGRPSVYVKLHLSLTLVIAIFIGLGMFFRTYSGYRELRNALQQGKTVVVEGKVENFVPMPYEGHSTESFTVAGHHYEYSDFEITGGFNNTSSHGGPIRPGMYVRIHSLGNRIARLEVAR